MASHTCGSIDCGSSAQQLLVRLARRLADDAVLHHDDGAREAGEALGRFAQEPRRLLECIRRLREVAHAHIDGREHIPAAAVLGMVAQVRFDAGDEIGGGRLLASAYRGVPRRAAPEVAASRRRDRAPMPMTGSAAAA